MLVIFEVYLASEDQASTILSPETLESTKAQILTPDEATKIGVQGVPKETTHPLRLLVAAAKDMNFLSSQLEGNLGVVGFRVHQIDV